MMSPTREPSKIRQIQQTMVTGAISTLLAFRVISPRRFRFRRHLSRIALQPRRVRRKKKRQLCRKQTLCTLKVKSIFAAGLPQRDDHVLGSSTVLAVGKLNAVTKSNASVVKCLPNIWQSLVNLTNLSANFTVLIDCHILPHLCKNGRIFRKCCRSKERCFKKYLFYSLFKAQEGGERRRERGPRSSTSMPCAKASSVTCAKG